MQPKTLFINGHQFSTLNGFYDEAERVLTKGLDWQAGHNLDAFNDLLYGGFGVTGPNEPFTLVWQHSTKSRHDLGRAETIRYYERKLSSSQPIQYDLFVQKLANIRRGEGETLFDILVHIIQTHAHITLVLEN